MKRIRHGAEASQGLSLSRRNLLQGAAALATPGCGYLLYPERRGRQSGSVDTPILFVDLVWLLPGIIPGVICLGVDFGTGAIYEQSGGSVAHHHGDPVEARVQVDGRTRARGRAAGGRRIELSGWDADSDAVRDRGELIVRSADGAEARSSVRALLTDPKGP